MIEAAGWFGEGFQLDATGAGRVAESCCIPPLPPQDEGGALYPEMEEDMYESLQLQYEELYMFLKENSRKSKVRLASLFGSTDG